MPTKPLLAAALALLLATSAQGQDSASVRPDFPVWRPVPGQVTELSAADSQGISQALATEGLDTLLASITPRRRLLYFPASMAELQQWLPGPSTRDVRLCAPWVARRCPARHYRGFSLLHMQVYARDSAFVTYEVYQNPGGLGGGPCVYCNNSRFFELIELGLFPWGGQVAHGTFVIGTPPVLVLTREGTGWKVNGIWRLVYDERNVGRPVETRR
jgi:hypothetical protein